MRNTTVRFSAWIAVLALAGLGPAGAEIGPCRPDGLDGLTCGEGAGAARVVDGTISPSKRLALAWRSTADQPSELPSDDDLELLVIRIKDGGVLSKRMTEYWDTGKSHVNRLQETATWSPNSRLVINTFEERFNTATVDLYAFDAKDSVTGPFNLLRILEAATRAQLRRRVKNDEAYEFSLVRERLRIENRGLVHATIMLWVPKNGPERNYDMTLQVAQKGGGLDAKVLSIRRSRAEP
jgi:hypothetical protein